MRDQCRQALKLISVDVVDAIASVGSEGGSDDDDGRGVVGCVCKLGSHDLRPRVMATPAELCWWFVAARGVSRLEAVSCDFDYADARRECWSHNTTLSTRTT